MVVTVVTVDVMYYARPRRSATAEAMHQLDSAFKVTRPGRIWIMTNEDLMATFHARPCGTSAPTRPPAAAAPRQPRAVERIFTSSPLTWCWCEHVAVAARAGSAPLDAQPSYRPDDGRTDDDRTGTGGTPQATSPGYLEHVVVEDQRPVLRTLDEGGDPARRVAILRRVPLVAPVAAHEPAV
jgi:hypothetical protein